MKDILVSIFHLKYETMYSPMSIILLGEFMGPTVGLLLLGEVMGPTIGLCYCYVKLWVLQ
jgi:hypothetical protein